MSEQPRQDGVPPQPTVVEMFDSSNANVAGYVRTAQRRLRRQMPAEGGHGTKRSRHLVTAGVERRLPTTDTKAEARDDDGEEEEVVPLEGRPSSEAPRVSAVLVVDDDGDEWDQIEVEVKPEAKKEERKAEGKESGVKREPQQNPQQRESAVLPLPTNRDEQIAQRRSERCHEFCRRLTAFLLMVHRGRLWFRLAHHPSLWEQLAHPRFGALEAVAQAKIILAETPNPSGADLKPCWVSARSDPVGTPTSRAAVAILQWMNRTFACVQADGTADNAACPISAASQLTPLLQAEIATSQGSNGVAGPPFTVPLHLHLSLVFLAVAAKAGLVSKRLVLSFDLDPFAMESPAADAELELAEPLEDDVVEESTTSRKRQRSDASSVRTGKSWVWVDLWCPVKQKFFCVNPSPATPTVWGAPYVLAVSYDHVADVTCRHISKWSDVAKHRIEAYFGVQRGYLWKRAEDGKTGPKLPEVHRTSESVDAIARVVRHFNQKHATERTSTTMIPRETKQLTALLFSEPVPTTFQALKKHPLYICEADVGRFEGIWPKDKTTLVGVLKNKNVYKRSAIVPLLSRDGWLRAHRRVLAGIEPAKTIPPPPSRPLVKDAQLFGLWQTEPFTPLPPVTTIDDEGVPTVSIPSHGDTHWYILLDQPAPAGLSHLGAPNVAKVARRIGCEYRYAVVGFEKKGTHIQHTMRWTPIIRGVIVLEKDAPTVARAHAEWAQMQEEAERRRRRIRVFKWWRLLIQRRMAMARLESRFLL